MALADTNALFYAYLCQQPSLVAALTSGGKAQIYGPPGVPASWSLTKGLTFWRQNTSTSKDLPMLYTTYPIRCYGPKPWDAEAVYLTLKPFVHVRPATRIPIGGLNGMLQYAEIQAGPVDMMEPDPLNWPYVLLTVNVHWIESIA